MVILVSPDSHGRITLGTKIAREAHYAVDVDTEGVITLTPSVVMSKKDFELANVRPVLSPDEAFGLLGSVEAAEAVQSNRSYRSAGDWGSRIPDSLTLHTLLWGDAA